jgi:hypothetical protein
MFEAKLDDVSAGGRSGDDPRDVAPRLPDPRPPDRSGASGRRRRRRRAAALVTASPALAAGRAAGAAGTERRAHPTRLALPAQLPRSPGPHFLPAPAPRRARARALQGSVIRKLIDSIKDLVTDANLECSGDGISLQASDGRQRGRGAAGARPQRLAAGAGACRL